MTPTREDRDREAGDDEGRQRDPGGDSAGPRRHDGVALDCRRRPIADASDRRDVPRSIRVVAELVPQPADVDVDRPVQDLGLVLAVDGVEQLVPGQNSTARLEEGHEKAELDGRKWHEPISDPDLVAIAIDDQVGVPDRFPSATGCAARPAASAGPIEDPLDAQDELGG